jgi:hypothetical protein
MTSLSLKLENGFAPKVKQGDKVVSGQVIAVKTSIGEDHEIHVAKILGVPASSSAKYLLKNLGDRVGEGEIIALKKGALGIGKKKVISPVSGTVFKIDELQGSVIIKSSGESQTADLFCPVDGEVELCDNEKIVIRVPKGGIIAKSVLGRGEIEAVLFAIEDDEVNPAVIKSDIRGKVVAGKNLDREAIAKSLGLGAAAIMGSNIREEDIENLKEKRIDTPVFILGEEDIEKVIKENWSKIHLDTEKKAIIFLK